MAALTVGQEFDAFDVTFAGSYRRKTLDYDIEAGAFPGFLTSAPGLPLAVIDNRSRQRDGSAEFRIASKASASLQWTVGLFYEEKRNRYGQDLTVAARKSVVSGKSVSVRVDLGGCGIFKKKNK